MSITKDTIIGELVAQDYRTASIFKQNKIDFCCNGNRTIEDACLQKKIDSMQLIQHLEEATTNSGNSGVDFNSFPLDVLADYIQKKHHRYAEAKMQEIIPYLNKIIKVHGSHHPELEQVGELFNETASELTVHMKKEELMLFPFIKKLEYARESGTPVQAPFGSVENPIQMMLHDHDTEGERFRKIAALTDNYNPPADACTTYKVTFSLLKEFEEDLHLHIHLENNILFPRAIKAEKTMNYA